MKLSNLHERSFNDLYDVKNKWIKLLKSSDKKELQNNLYVLINNAYGVFGGHVHIKSPSDILNTKLTYWQSLDNDVDPDADVVLFGKKTQYGIKISGWGHDGTTQSKSDLINKAASQLKKKGYWIEVSGRPAEIFLNKNVPIIDDQKTVEKLLGKKVEWDKDGWYHRIVGGKNRKEIMIGVPS